MYAHVISSIFITMEGASKLDETHLVRPYPYQPCLLIVNNAPYLLGPPPSGYRSMSMDLGSTDSEDSDGDFVPQDFNAGPSAPANDDLYGTTESESEGDHVPPRGTLSTAQVKSYWSLH